MIRIVQVLAVLAAIVAAFLLGRYTAGPGENTRVPAPAGGSEVAVATDVGTGPETTDAKSSRADDGAQPPPSPSAANSASGTAGSAPSAGMHASGGPRPLLETDLPRFAETENRIRADRGVWADLLDLAEEEERDDDAQRLEQMLALSIRRHGDHMTELRLSSPRCTRSVCILRGVGLGHTQDPRSDWQRLLGKLMNEAWFRNAFDDMRGSVGGDGGDTLYHTILVRCEPGTCRWGRR